MTQAIAPLSDREKVIIKQTVLTYKRFMTAPAIVDGKKVQVKLRDFTLGDLAKQINRRLTQKDEIVKDQCEVLRKFKNEVVVL